MPEPMSMMRIEKMRWIKPLCLVMAFSPVIVDANESVDTSQIELAARIGAQCSGFYDGVFALMQNLESNKQSIMLDELEEALPGLSQTTVFRDSTASILLTRQFLALLNNSVKPEKPFTLEDYREDYIQFRREAMGWSKGEVEAQFFTDMHNQCQHIQSISEKNGSLTLEMLNSAVEKRASALGVALD
jgi:ribosome-binding protein aMBF1 (putative translation factor)